jgi:hypothetical protein
VTKTFYMGVEAIYEDLKSASTGATTVGGYGSCTGVSAATCTVGSASQSESQSSTWTFRFRMHKDFLP